MMPLYLSIEGINSFREKQEIDFSKVSENRIFCISGETGSGKTTILDCIIIALFGRTSRASLRDCINLSRGFGEVRFRFEFESSVYEVERIIKPTSVKATLTNVSSGEILADQTEKVTARVEQLLKITKDEFTKIIILEQGKFASFMTSGKTDRNAAVSHIFGLDRFDNLRGIFKEAYTKYNTQISKFSDLLDTVKYANNTLILEAAADIKRDGKTLDKLEAERENIRAKLKDVNARTAVYQTRVNARAELSSAQDALQRLKSDENILKDKLSAIEAKNSAQNTLSGESNFARKMLEKINECRNDFIELTKKEASRAGLLEQYTSVKSQLDKATEKDKVYAEDIEKNNAKLGEIIREISSVVLCDLPIENLRESDVSVFREKCVNLEAQQKKNDINIKELGENLLEQTARQAKEKEIQLIAIGNLNKLKLELDELGEKREKVKRELADAEKNNAAAFVASGMHDGDTCPVCGGKFCGAHIENLGLEAFEKTLSDIEKKIKVASDEVTKNHGQQMKSDTSIVAYADKIAQLNKDLEQEYAIKEQLDKKIFDIQLLSGVIGKIDSAITLLKSIEKMKGVAISFEPERARLIERRETITRDGERTAGEISDLRKKIHSRIGDRNIDELEGECNMKLELEASGIVALNALKSDYDQENAKYLQAFSQESTKLAAAKKILDESEDVSVAEGELFETERRAKEIEKEISEKIASKAKTESALETMESDLVKKNEYAQKIAENQKKYDSVNRLKKIFEGQNKFLQYVSEEYILDFTEQANEVLGTLTENRYALEYDEDGDFMVRDFNNGNEQRKLKTLSGGETFLASMSVAIAISRAIAADRNYEFFFLDEGFGTLDDGKIDVVLAALVKLAEDTIVGLVSHRQELTSRIANQIQVTKDSADSGSVIKIIS